MTERIDASRLVGTWKLIGGKATGADGTPLPSPYGPKAMGLITLTAGGRLMAVLCDGRAILPEGTTREFSSYAGNYEFDGATLVTTVDASSTARAALGSRQIRQIRFDGDILVLLPPPSIVNGTMQQREMSWERMSSVSA